VDIGRAQSLVQAIGGGKPSFVVTANLGVGGNPRKRVPGDFELHLIRSLLDEGSRVILDHGAGEDESRVEAIVSTLRSEGRRIGDISGTDFSTTALSRGCDLLAYRGGVAPFAALAGAGDLYVGYDSAFQHIAAALGTPVVDVFVNPPNAIFPRRWKPHSVAPVTVIEVTDDAPDLVARIADVHRLFRQSTASR
jgi:ADP-heptose:LPS heptosyltransferase